MAAVTTAADTMAAVRTAAVTTAADTTAADTTAADTMAADTTAADNLVRLPLYHNISASHPMYVTSNDPGLYSTQPMSCLKCAPA